MVDRFDIESFARDPDRVARLLRAEDVFSFLNRRVTVPASCVALVRGDAGQPALAPAGRPIESQDVRELLLVRATAFFLEYAFDGLRSKDDYSFSATARVSVQAIPDRAELAAFRKCLLGSGNEVNVAHLRRHCEEVVQASLAAFARGRAAADLASAATWNAVDEVLAEHFRPVGFESGLALGPDPRVTFTSQSYADARRADATAARRREQVEAERRLRGQTAQAREEHLAEVGALIERVKEMSRETPGVAVVDLIKSFDPAQRGPLYEGLAVLHPPARPTEAILVVAGEAVLWFDSQRPDRPSRRRDLASDVGALRSVRIAESPGQDARLLVGANTGVHLLSADGELLQTYTCATDKRPRGGFNAAVILNDALHATHSELGLVTWPLDSPQAPSIWQPDDSGHCKAVRDLQRESDADGARLWFSADQNVVGMIVGGSEEVWVQTAPAVVTALLAADGSIWAGLENGAIVRWIGADAALETIRQPCGRAVRSLAWLAGGGIPRLLIADGRPHLDFQVLGDTYHGEYRCKQKVRWGFAAEDCIVGVNDRRDRLLIWRLDAPQEPSATVSVGRLCGHSIQDVALLPGPQRGR